MSLLMQKKVEQTPFCAPDNQKKSPTRSFKSLVGAEGKIEWPVGGKIYGIDAFDGFAMGICVRTKLNSSRSMVDSFDPLHARFRMTRGPRKWITELIHFAIWTREYGRRWEFIDWIGDTPSSCGRVPLKVMFIRGLAVA